MPNPIFDASNVSLTVTNLYGSYSFSTLDGIPLTTSNGAATGRLAVPVVTVGSQGYTTASAATPITTGTTYSSSAVSAGTIRLIQNHSTSPVYVSLAGTASSTVLTFILPACSVARDGTSPLVPISFTGIITFYSPTTLDLSVTSTS